MNGKPSLPDRAVHSDFLVHWTGSDIDQEFDACWASRPDGKSKSGDVDGYYLERLRSILSHGLWLSCEATPEEYKVGGEDVTIPPTPRCCFTELKLSESRRHARRYGRLGIGVKRPYLFARFGRPLAYFGFGPKSHKDKLLEAFTTNEKDQWLLNFFKPMNVERGPLTYQFYSESEWRILFFKELEKQGLIIDPKKRKNTKQFEYYKALPDEAKARLAYLMPLDGWFSLIIYPSISAKNKAHRDASIRTAIENIKAAPDHGNCVEGLDDQPPGNWPIELDLDACQNF